MNKCPNCGTVTDGAFCPVCGQATAEIPVQPAPQPVQQPAPQVIVNNTVPKAITKDDLPEQYRPLSAWAYWGLSILYAVPIVGFIFLIINSFNGSNINRRSFTRSYWINTIISLVIIGIVCIILAATGGFAYLSRYFDYLSTH